MNTSKVIARYEITTLEELNNNLAWLPFLLSRGADEIYLNDFTTLVIIEETLTDGSRVFNIKFTMGGK